MWTVETSAIPGLYDVYDEDGNRVVRHTTHERACLVAAAPKMWAALMQVTGLARSGDNRVRKTQLQMCRFLDTLLTIAALPLQQAEGGSDDH